MQHGPKPIHHHFRIYIVVITILVGGIFLLTNFSSKENIITGDSILDATSEPEIVQEPAGDQRVTQFIFSNIPHVTEKTSIPELWVNSNDFETVISINDDTLELPELVNIDLLVQNFEGAMEFSKDGISLSGLAKRIEVNGLAFSSNKGIEIAFTRLEYNKLSLPSVNLNDVLFSKGEGSLAIGKKLDYSLNKENVKIKTYLGSVYIDKNSNSTVQMDGYASGITISGENLELTVK